MATATAPLVIRRPPADAAPRPGRAARDVLQLGTVLVIARPASRPSEWNIVVLFPWIGELLRPQRGEGPRHPLAGGTGHDHLDDEALFGGHEGVGEAVLVVLRPLGDLLPVGEFRPVEDLDRALGAHPGNLRRRP